MGELLQASLFARRIVSVTGYLDATRAGDAAAALMTLDALDDTHIDLRIDCRDGSLDGALTLVDTIDVLGVPVHATCIGTAGGAAVAVLAVAHRRLITAHGTVHLAEPSDEMTGRASDLARWAAHHQARLVQLQRRLADATGQPFEHVEADMERGRYLQPAEAVAYGIVDEVIGRPAG
jgi:ATP-dependent Clp protease protease subunit